MIKDKLLVIYHTHTKKNGTISRSTRATSNRTEALPFNLLMWKELIVVVFIICSMSHINSCHNNGEGFNHGTSSAYMDIIYNGVSEQYHISYYVYWNQIRSILHPDLVTIRHIRCTCIYLPVELG